MIYRRCLPSQHTGLEAFGLGFALLIALCLTRDAEPADPDRLIQLMDRVSSVVPV